MRDLFTAMGSMRGSARSCKVHKPSVTSFDRRASALGPLRQAWRDGKEMLIAKAGGAGRLSCISAGAGAAMLPCAEARPAPPVGKARKERRQGPTVEFFSPPFCKGHGSLSSSRFSLLTLCGLPSIFQAAL